MKNTQDRGAATSPTAETALRSKAAVRSAGISAFLLRVLSATAWVLLLVLACGATSRAATLVTLYPIPQEVRSTHYTVTINGRSTPVVHAASNYYLLNFDTAGPVTIRVTASDPHFWDRGVEVQPMRLGIRPVRRGATISFHLAGPQKVSISRPGDHFAEADMLFLFANSQEQQHVSASSPGIRYYGPGVHHGSINAQSGDSIYLAAGAVVFGSLNIWQVHDVHVFGRGMIVYDGPQNPADDDGWMHKRDWHAIVMDQAHNIEIDGITTVVRSRTWQIQMKDSRNIGFYNIKVIAGTAGDANQDGMDWLGGGDTTVRDSFFRASDDVFALQGNWDGYSNAAMRIPGHDVTNISIERTTVSTSISNIVRVGWPQKTFNSAHLHMQDVDVLHTGFGECKVPFAFFELWADPGGSGSHSDYHFADIRLEDWYSLFQLRQALPSIRDVSFVGMWAMDGPGMLPSEALGNVRQVAIQDVAEGQDRPADIAGGAAPLIIKPAVAAATFTYTPGALQPHQPVHFTADAPEAAGRHFEWLFGDSARSEGRDVSHAFPDAEGTLLDGSGRFRVLLHVTENNGTQAWGSQSIVVAPRALESSLQVAGVQVHTFVVPAAGGYTFTLLTSKATDFAIDDLPAQKSPIPRTRVCGSPDDALQPVRVSAVLQAGKHQLRVNSADDSVPLVLWEGPGLPRQRLALDR